VRGCEGIADTIKCTAPIISHSPVPLAAFCSILPAVLRQIFDSPGWLAVKAGQKTRLELKSGANVYGIEIDSEGRVYVAVVTGEQG
jgi:hypothetical protein